MNKGPRRKGERLLTGVMLRRLAVRGGLIAAASLGVLAGARFWLGQPWTNARALLFTALAFSQLAYAAAVHGPLRTRRVNGQLAGPINFWLPAALAVGIVLQLAVLTWEPARIVFDTAPVGGKEWLLVLGCALIPAALIATRGGKDTD